MTSFVSNVCGMCSMKTGAFLGTAFKWPVTDSQSVSQCESLSVAGIIVRVPGLTAICQYESLSVTGIRVSVSP